jgi:hypothetical protein
VAARTAEEAERLSGIIDTAVARLGSADYSARLTMLEDKVRNLRLMGGALVSAAIFAFGLMQRNDDHMEDTIRANTIRVDAIQANVARVETETIELRRDVERGFKRIEDLAAKFDGQE